MKPDWISQSRIGCAMCAVCGPSRRDSSRVAPNTARPSTRGGRQLRASARNTRPTPASQMRDQIRKEYGITASTAATSTTRTMRPPALPSAAACEKPASSTKYQNSQAAR